MVPSRHHSMMSSVLLCALLIGVSEMNDADTLHRERRQLLWTNSTLLQLNIGVTTPTPIKTINVGWAFQANFQLPWNRSQIPLDLLEANSGYVGLSRRKRGDGDYENDGQLSHFYRYVEDLLNSYGHNGTSCVLRTLCQLGAEPLHTDDEEDLLHELTTFILNPFNDVTDGPSSAAAPYVQAFRHGQKLLDCSRTFDCPSISLIDMFSKKQDERYESL